MNKLLTALAVISVINTPVYAAKLTPAQIAVAAEEVRIAQTARSAEIAARDAAIVAEQDRQIALVFGPAKTIPTIVTPSVVVPPITTVITPVVAPTTVVRSTYTGLPILTQYNTPELTANSISAGKTNDDVLNIINAEYAWSRGYTGKGSTILVIDSGINAAHQEFAGSIGYTKDFINSKFGMADQIGHGTGLAGIAAGNWDGLGMAGVAPDATLAIAKVTDTKVANFGAARNALVWGNSIGAVVANISANYTHDAAYTRNMVKLSDGNFTNTDPRYIGKYFMNEDPQLWAKSLSPNMVIVNSAGNGGFGYSYQPGTLATAVDSSGKLILGGQMLIVGAWDTGTNSIASYSNKAGTICKIVVNGACGDAYKVSDFFIMAPGNVFVPTRTGTDAYAINTGTSQAAAVVSGSVAVINQMWPQMTAANIVKLLLVTANKDLPGYDVNIMGQGLLDLERATRPVGELGIPTVGRTGTTVASGTFSTSTSAGLSSLNTKLSSVMTLDSFGRDYYVNLSQASNNKTPRVEFNPFTNASFYEDYNPYNKLNYFTNNGKIQSGEYDIKLSMNQYSSQAMAEVGKTTKFSDVTKMRVGFGSLNERDSWTGNSISGALGTVNGSYTTYTNIGGVHNLNKHISVIGSMWFGYTRANLQQTGLITNIGDTQSYSWNMGVDYTKDAHSFGTTVSQPMTVYKGTVDVAIPIGLTANGAVAYDRSTVNITPTVHEYDFGVYYKYKSSAVNVIAYGEHQVNYLNQQGVSNNTLGLSLVKVF